MVAHVAVLSDEWKELHVRVRLDQIISSPLEEREISLESRDAVALTVEAATAQEGRGFFTSQNFGVHDGGRNGSGVVQPLRNKQQEIIMNKITSINGILLTPLNEWSEHVENETAHVTEEERTAWNAKADAAALSTKVDASSFNAHKEDAAAHITVQERETWNGKQDKLTDEAGNMTLDGGLTAEGTVNANGGINIPLTVGAQTGTAAVNRLYAAGLAGATNVYTMPYFPDTSKIVTTGSAVTAIYVPYHYARVTAPANKTSSIKFPFLGLYGGWNYSNFAGFSISLHSYTALKFTIGLGAGAKTYRSDLTLDSYALIPGNDLAYANGEILDITFDAVRDTVRNGYTIIVREIYAEITTQKWKVKTTTSFVPASHNELIPATLNKIIYQQSQPASYSKDYDGVGSLYLMLGGSQQASLCKIAAVRGLRSFETSFGFSSCYVDLAKVDSGTAVVEIGSTERTLYQPNNINPVAMALGAIAANTIVSEVTEDFVDINTPLA